MDVRMQNRLEYLTQTCSKYGLDKPGTAAQEPLINSPTHSLIPLHRKRFAAQTECVGVPNQQAISCDLVQRLQGGLHVLDVQFQPDGGLLAPVPAQVQPSAAQPRPQTLPEALREGRESLSLIVFEFI